jgi:hypothetical protein
MENKICPHCQKEIDAKARKCPYCQSDLRNFIFRHPILTIVGLLIVLVFVGRNVSETTPSGVSQPINQNPPASKSASSGAQFTNASIHTLEHDLASVAKINDYYFVETSGTVVSAVNFILEGDKQPTVALYVKDGGDGMIVSLGKGDEAITDRVEIGDVVQLKGVYSPPLNDGYDMCDINNTKRTPPAGKSLRAMCKMLGASASDPFIITIEPTTIIKKSNSGVSAKVSISTAVEAPTPIKYSDFQALPLSDYRKDPLLYVGKSFKLPPAQINNFLPAGDRGGDANYLSVTDANPTTFSGAIYPYAFALTTEDFKKAVKALNENDVVVAYGVGIPSREFTNNSGVKTIVPTILVLRLDKCAPSADDICASKTTIFAEVYKLSPADL